MVISLSVWCCYVLWFEAVLPDGFDAVADIVEDVTALDATAWGEETADDAGDVATDVELLRVVDTGALHTKAETADAWEDHRLALP